MSKKVLVRTLVSGISESKPNPCLIFKKCLEVKE